MTASTAVTGLCSALARCPLDIFLDDLQERLRSPRSSIAAMLEVTIDRLQRDRARSRLGPALADALSDRLRRRAIDPAALDSRKALVHGDVSGRNVLVRAVNDRWQVAALLDWEHAFIGSPLWDVGSLFRYAHRYSERFRSGFEEGYRAAGGVLPADWHLVSRLLDATRLVEIVNGAEDLPGVFRECQDLIEKLVRGKEAAPPPSDVNSGRWSCATPDSVSTVRKCTISPAARSAGPRRSALSRAGFPWLLLSALRARPRRRKPMSTNSSSTANPNRRGDGCSNAAWSA